MISIYYLPPNYGPFLRKKGTRDCLVPNHLGYRMLASNLIQNTKGLLKSEAFVAFFTLALRIKGCLTFFKKFSNVVSD